MNTIENKSPLFPGVKDGETFTVAGMEFIKFPSVNGQTPVVMRDLAFVSKFGANNDLRSSGVLRKMETDVLPKIIAAVGEENLCTIKTDLTTLDGLAPWNPLSACLTSIFIAPMETFSTDTSPPDGAGWPLLNPQNLTAIPPGSFAFRPPAASTTTTSATARSAFARFVFSNLVRSHEAAEKRSHQ